MRTLCLVAVLLALPFTATAQQSDREHHDGRHDDRGSRGGAPASPSSTTTTSTAPGTLPPIGLPPVVRPAVPAWEQKQVPWWERQTVPAWERPSLPPWERPQAPPQVTSPKRGDDHNAPRDYRFRPGTWPGGPILYVVPPVSTPPAPAASTTPPPGALRIEVEPRAIVQVFVDEVFVGSPEDHGGRLELAPGVRRVELRARGYKPLVFDAEIVSEKVITYRGFLETDREEQLKSVAPPAPAPVKSWSTDNVAPTTIYVIPGCYLGNVQPKAEDMKPGCDVRTMIKRAP